MVGNEFIVKPITKKKAKELCANHPHAQTLPNSSKYYMQLLVNRKPAGLAVWGWGIRPTETPKRLFKNEMCGVRDYLELSRFFVYDWCLKNTASHFLAITHRIIKKQAPWVKWLYTYAAGFQGMVGTIYKAVGYDYIGKKRIGVGFVYIPKIGLIHPIAQWHRYSKVGIKEMVRIYPTAKRWCGYNFCYIYWLCGKQEKEKLLQNANFKIIRSYPTMEDIEIWTEDENGNKTPVSIEFAKTIPIVKLKSKRPAGEKVSRLTIQLGVGGALPTVGL